MRPEPLSQIHSAGQSAEYGKHAETLRTGPRFPVPEGLPPGNLRERPASFTPVPSSLLFISRGGRGLRFLQHRHGFKGRPETSGSRSTPEDGRSTSPANILRRVAEPVEPFGFKFLQNDLPPPLRDGRPDRSGQPPGLFAQVEENPADALQGVHWRKQRFSLNCPQSAPPSGTTESARRSPFVADSPGRRSTASCSAPVHDGRKDMRPRRGNCPV